MSEKKYNFWITLKKGALIFVYGGIGAIISWLTSLPETETIGITILLLTMLQNFIKHYNDGKK